MKATKRTKTVTQRTDTEKLDEIIRLLQFNVAIELMKLGLSQQQIAKSLGVATVAVNNMLKGAKRD